MARPELMGAGWHDEGAGWYDEGAGWYDDRMIGMSKPGMCIGNGTFFTLVITKMQEGEQ